MTPFKNPKASQEPNPEATPEPERIPIDGFQQVLEMLRVADPEFRESLLKRLALRDKKLATTLRRDL